MIHVISNFPYFGLIDCSRLLDGRVELGLFAEIVNIWIEKQNSSLDGTQILNQN